MVLSFDKVVQAEVSTDKGRVSVSSVVVEGGLENLGHSEERKSFPSESHSLEVFVAEHELSRQPVPSEPGEVLDALMSLVKSSHVPSVFVLHGGREQVSESVVITVHVVPVKTIILNGVLMEPRSSRLLGNTAEVTHRADFIQHIFCLL